MRKKALIQALTGTTHIVCENIETDNTAGAMNIIEHPDENVHTVEEFAGKKSAHCKMKLQ